MTSFETLTTFLGWCTVINIGIILLATLMLNVFREIAGNLNARIFGVTPDEANVTLFRLIQHYRLAILVLNFVPYLALKIMTGPALQMY